MKDNFVPFRSYTRLASASVGFSGSSLLTSLIMLYSCALIIRKRMKKVLILHGKTIRQNASVQPKCYKESQKVYINV